MHKSRRQTVEKVLINLQKAKANVGLTFVYVVQTKKLMDLLVEPMPLDSLRTR